MSDAVEPKRRRNEKRGRKEPSRRHRGAPISALTLGALLLGTAGVERAEGYEQRRNTISLGFQAGVIAFDSDGKYERAGFELAGGPYRYRDFRWGPALGFRLRYSLDQSHALGVSFEDLRFRRKSGLSAPVAKEYQVNNFMLDYYLYVQRRQRLTPYFVIGAGFHRDAFRFSRSDNLTPPLAVVANLGTGLEYFLRPAFSLDLALRGYYLGLRGSGDWNLSGSGAIAGTLQLGFQYYLIN